jgi:nucleotide-binding universal stress UspA family protein
MKTNTDTILVPIDFNEQSMFAMERLYYTAPFLNLDIVLLYVFEEKGISGSLVSKEEFSNRIRQELDKTASEIQKKSGKKVTTIVKKGKVYSQILSTSTEVNARFILMGTNNSSENIRMDKNIIGSNTLRVVRQSKIPVITINGKKISRIVHNILLPLDLTKETRQKVTNAIDIAKSFGAGITAISVLWSKKDKDTKAELLQQLDQVRIFIEDSNIRCVSELLEADGGERMLAPRILQYVEDNGNIDLIMIMTQQENKLVEYFLGSAAQSIIRMSKIAVMTITPDEIGNEQPIF